MGNGLSIHPRRGADLGITVSPSSARILFQHVLVSLLMETNEPLALVRAENAPTPDPLVRFCPRETHTHTHTCLYTHVHALTDTHTQTHTTCTGRNAQGSVSYLRVLAGTYKPPKRPPITRRKMAKTSRFQAGEYRRALKRKNLERQP